MTNAPLIPVLLSGGAGTRLWPVSRRAHPKPFMRLPDGETLLGKTLRRARAVAPDAPVLTVTARDYLFVTRDEYAACEPNARELSHFLLEPAGRNTAPAVVLAALWAVEKLGPDATLLVLPADHLIRDVDASARAVDAARALAADGRLVTFGVVPTRPETGYGYIQRGSAAGAHGHAVERFVEKPDFETAQRYVDSGD